jgi:hypothetical protein
MFVQRPVSLTILFIHFMKQFPLKIAAKKSLLIVLGIIIIPVLALSVGVYSMISDV